MIAWVADRASACVVGGTLTASKPPPARKPEFVAKAEIQRQVLGCFPVILHEPIEGLLVPRELGESRAAERSVRAVGDQVVDQRTERGIVPLAARTRQEILRRNPVPVFSAPFELMRAETMAEVGHTLVGVLDRGLRRIAFRPETQPGVVDADVRKVL